MKFLKQFLITCLGYILRKFKDSSDTSSNDSLARFLTSKRHFIVDKLRVQPQAFMPKQLKCSVYQINNLSLSDILKLAVNNEVTTQSGKPPYGWAAISVYEIEKIKKLKVDKDNVPERHANIIGWPEEKSEQKLLALELVESSKLILQN